MAAVTSEHIISIEELRPDVSHLVTEDDTPVDNLFSEKQQRLLTEPLYTSWQPRTKDKHSDAHNDEANDKPRLFLAMANVGLYYGVRQDPLVPDVMVSLDVQAPADWWEKYNRCYMVWEFGKMPEIVLEIVSNLHGEELGKKLHRYEQIGVLYYAVFDPAGHYGAQRLRLFHRIGNVFQEVERIDPKEFPLALTLWEGEYEGATAEWLRWTDHNGNMILTGSERVKEEQQRVKEAQQRVKEAQQRVKEAQQRANEAQQRAKEAEQRMNEAQQQAESAESALAQERLANERLAAKLRELGINPETL